MGPLLEEHWGYVSDPVRLGCYESAIAAVVKPGDRVADLGCGTGVLSLMCLRAGAARVYAIDSTRMLDLARDSLTRCGLDDGVTFVRGRAQAVTLPEKVDVVICDHVGWFGFDYGIVGLMADARARFLAPGGTVIPGALDLIACGVESKRGRALADRWAAPQVPPEFHWVRESCVNMKHSIELAPDELLCAPSRLGRIALDGDSPGFLSWTAEFVAARAGSFDGLAGWCEAHLAPGVAMTNSPLQPRINRPQVFMPIGESVQVEAGEGVHATVMARPAAGLLAWKVEFPARGLSFSHSTWHGMLLSPQDLIRASPGHVPVVSPEARARGIVLGYCDGQRTAREIEAAVLRDHPEILPSKEETSRFVVEVLAGHTRW